MIDRVSATIFRYRMFESGQKVGIAVSGGADSVCLLHVLHEIAPRWDLRLSILHLNHKLRGEESDTDAEFVRSLAASFGFPFVFREVDLFATAGNLEEIAREARLAFFGEQIASGNIDRVALGHTRSDQAETVLFRFLRGAGTAGLAGIRPVTKSGLVRPLLNVDRADVERFLRDRGVVWREDSSNRSLEFARNRIRQQLLPALARDWNPAIVQALAQTADWALEEEAYWEAEIDRLAAKNLIIQKFPAPKNPRLPAPDPRLLKVVSLQTTCLRDLPLAAARRLIRRAMEIVKGDLIAIDFAHVNAVLLLAAATEGHGRIQPPGLDIIRSFDWLRFAKPAEVPGLETRNYAFPVPVPAILPIPGENYSISLELFENATDQQACECVYNKRMVWVDQERLSGPLTLRNWRPGDQYHPLGSSAEQKIKTLFQEFRIPLWERRHWPVLIDGCSIVWARRFGPATRVAARPKTRRFLKIEEVGIERRENDV